MRLSPWRRSAVVLSIRKSRRGDVGILLSVCRRRGSSDEEIRGARPMRFRRTAFGGRGVAFSLGRSGFEGFASPAGTLLETEREKYSRMSFGAEMYRSGRRGNHGMRFGSVWECDARFGPVGTVASGCPPPFPMACRPVAGLLVVSHGASLRAFPCPRSRSPVCRGRCLFKLIE